MYSDKKNILQLVALLIEHGVSNIVLCPGSRNSPIVHTLANHSFFNCHSVTDERSAGFFAVGLALHGGKPAAVCCTSGTALLNIHPAVAEAFYQKVPLVVISADRPAAWIGQMDGQTLPQPGVFGSLVKKSVQLPEIHTDQDEWYCNRLINEALLELNHHGKGPVHINVPISEPLFQFTTPELPKVRVITRYQGLNVYDRKYDDLIERLNKYSKRMMIAGQMSLIYLFEKKICKLLYKHFTWLSEHIGNRIVPGLPIKNFDAILYATPEEEKEKLVPELVITYGGHIVSKRLKEFLRKHPPKEHWHVSLDGEVADLFGLTYKQIYKYAMSFYKENKKGDLEVARQLGVKLPKWESQYERLYTDTKDCLKKLSRIYKIGVIANQSLGTSERLENLGVRKYLDLIIASAEEGVSKPDRRIFEIALERSSCKPENAVMIGDRIDNDIVPAKQLGMKTIWVKQGFGSLWNITDESEKADMEINNLSDVLKYL